MFFRISTLFSHDKRRGFSLIEIMIVLSVTFLLSGALLFYRRSADDQLLLFRERAVLFGMLQRAKSLAIKKLNDGPALTCAFGVHIDVSQRELILFKDKGDVGGSLDVFQCRHNNGRGSYINNFQYDGNTEKMDRYVLDPQIAVILAAQSGGPSHEFLINAFDVVFVPPDPVATSTYAFPLSVTLKTASGNHEAITLISEAGQITSP